MGIHLVTGAIFNMFLVLGYQWLDSDARQMFMLFPLGFGEGWESQFFKKKMEFSNELHTVFLLKLK